MNRLPAKPVSKRAADLEKRVSILTLLVAVQIVLLVILLVMEFVPFAGGDGPLESTRQDEIASPMGAGDADAFVAGAGEERMDAEESHSATDPDATTPPEPEPDQPIRVEILNGCGVRGLAARYAKLLRDAGYDVRDTRNADHHNYTKTQVIDRGTQPRAGQYLAETLGLAPAQISTKRNPDLVDVDATLILGDDYKTLNLHPTP